LLEEMGESRDTPDTERVSEKKGRRGRGAEEQRSRGRREKGEGRTDNFWRQSSRNPTQNFVHPY